MRFTTIGLILLLSPAFLTAAEMDWIIISPNGQGFVKKASGKEFTVWGFNYDHDRDGDLLEDYWVEEWETIVEDFQEMKDLGANTIRIHLQLGKFMQTAEQPNEESLKQLSRLVKLAEEKELYLDITGLGCYHKKDVPAWYDKLDVSERWNVQARFWEAVAKTCSNSPAVFCYDLMNEPVVPGGTGKREDWLAGSFGGKHFVQFIALENAGRERPEIAREWIHQMVTAIRKHDEQHLITVGLVPWSLDRPGLTSGFVPSLVGKELDFIAVHIYPESAKLDEALETLKGFDIGKPVIIEEIFPLKCTPQELEEFLKQSAPHCHGWIGFYWGSTPSELEEGTTIGEKITQQWLELFQKHGKKLSTN